jgi:hypothetical protein
MSLALLRAAGAAFATAFADVRGVEMHGARLHRSSNGTASIEIEGAGWSPTLHLLPMRWTIHLGDIVRRSARRAERAERDAIMKAVLGAIDGDAGAISALAERGLLTPTDEMRSLMASRAGIAAGHGFDQPLHLPTRTSPRDVDAIVLHHVQIDEAMSDLHAEQQFEQDGHLPSRLSLRRMFARDLVDLHLERSRTGETLHLTERHDSETGATTRHEVSASMRHEMPLLLPGAPIIRPSDRGRFLDAPTISFDGEHLHVPDRLPDTALAACVGLGVGDVVETGTPVDGRRIVAAEPLDEGFALTVVPELVSLDTLR